MKALRCFGISCVLVALTIPAWASGGGKIYLHPKNDCDTGDWTRIDTFVCQEGRTCTFKKGDRWGGLFPFENDEYRSLSVDSINNCTIKLYDEPDCDYDDDVTEIKIIRAQGICIPSFERDLTGGDWFSDSGKGSKNNGLDGKVSCIRMQC